MLWIWAACVFLVVDLFLNVPEFDRIRPDWDLYRSTRYAAHKMAGQPYEEQDRFNPGAATDNATRAAAQAYAKPTALTPSGEPYYAVDPRVMSRAELDTVTPPPAFRGSELEWRLLGKITVDEMRGLLTDFKSLTITERKAVLDRVVRAPDPQLTRALIAARGGVADSPNALSHYSFAGLAILVEVSRRAQESGRSPGVALDDELRSLANEIVAAQCRKAVRFAPHLSESGWGSIRATLERLEKAFPGTLRDPSHQQHVAEIRRSVEGVLRTAIDEEPGYRAGIEAMKLARVLATVHTIDLFLDLLRARQRVAARLTARGQESAFLGITMSTISSSGTERQMADFAELIAFELGQPDTPARERRLFRAHAQILVRRGAVSDSTLELLNKALLEQPK